MGFSSKQKSFCVENYSLLRSPKQVQLLFCKKYGLDSRSRSGIQTAKSIRRWYKQFNVSGCLSVGHKRRGISYAKPVRCGENIEAVLMSVEATQKKSVRRRSAELGVSQSSVHRILRLASSEHWDGSAAMKQEVSSGSCRTELLLIQQDRS